jgi:hypothetical protein
MNYARSSVAFAKPWYLPVAIFAALLVVLAAGAPRQLRAQDDKKSTNLNSGITISAQATAEEVGLPVYPGAKPHKDSSEDSSAANLGLWGGSFGFKLVVLKLDSADSSDKVAAFYRKALAKYGPVLDCANPPAAKSSDNDKSTKLTCGDDKPDPGSQLFKAGTKEKQHIVGIKPGPPGVTIQLVFLEARGTDHDAM